MPTVCSACGRELTPNLTNCPGCSFPIVAHAVPSKPQINWLWAVVLAGLVIIFVAASRDEKRKQEQHVADVAQVLGEINNGHISNGFDFQQHCGRAFRMTSLGKNLTLAYPNAGVMVLLTRLHPENAMDRTFIITFWSLSEPGRTMDPSSAIDALNCSA